MGLEGVVECKKMNNFNDLSFLGGASLPGHAGDGRGSSGQPWEKDVEAFALPDFNMDVDDSCGAQFALLLQVGYSVKSIISQTQLYYNIVNLIS